MSPETPLTIALRRFARIVERWAFEPRCGSFCCRWSDCLLGRPGTRHYITCSDCTSRWVRAEARASRLVDREMTRDAQATEAQLDYEHEAEKAREY